MRRWVSGLVIVAGLLLAGARPADACSCVPPDPPAVAFAAADYVFAGTVTRVDAAAWGIARFLGPLGRWLGLSPAGPGAEVRATLRVSDAWKGLTTSPVVVATSGSSASCGYAFAAGQDLVVYAYAGPDGAGTHLCTRTAERAQAAADLAFLQTQPALAVTAAGGVGAAITGGARLAAVAGGLILLAAAAAGVVAVVGRRRSVQ
jgi:hypothetical protein